MRTFEAKPAVRERVPIWLGLFGPPGAGKTYSALRLATGIAQESKGSIYVVDTEARRALHYADSFRFHHIDFGAPFSSGDYFGAIRHCVDKGASVVIVDSTSHEHEGAGGYLDTHDTELARIAGDDYAKRERANLAAWIKPSKQRTAFINSAVQLNTHIILCFRAKEKIKPVRDPKTGKTTPTEQGWQPISGVDILYSMTLNMLLLPRSGGVPTWDSDYAAERLMMKLPDQFRPLFADGRPLDEQHGQAIAKWAAGSSIAPTGDAYTPEPADEYTEDRVATMLAEASCDGMQALGDVWRKLPKGVQRQWKPRLDSEYKPIAAKFEDAKVQEQAEKRKAEADAPE